MISVIASAAWQFTPKLQPNRHHECSVATYYSDFNQSTPFTFNLMPIKPPCVYIQASKKNGTLHIGITSNLSARVWQHKHEVVEGFSQRYGIHNLVWYEVHPNVQSAIMREKQLKKGSRQRKIDLIDEMNLQW